nr:7-cyano-7-deazaguanine synthase QueC [Achromobacter sp. DMS1]
MQNHQRRALVLFSGGQDSTTCLAWALERYAHVETVAFDYGQRHRIELDARRQVLASLRARFPQWAARLGEDHLLDLKVLGQVGDTAMTSEREIEMQANGLPNTFVPGRNLLFLTLAAALGYRRQLDVLVGGMCETDFSGYPDCRDDTIKAQQVALGLGLGARVTIETPLMWIDKAETWALAETLGGQALVDIVVEDTCAAFRSCTPACGAAQGRAAGCTAKSACTVGCRHASPAGAGSAGAPGSDARPGRIRPQRQRRSSVPGAVRPRRVAGRGRRGAQHRRFGRPAARARRRPGPAGHADGPAHGLRQQGGIGHGVQQVGADARTWARRRAGRGPARRLANCPG